METGSGAPLTSLRIVALALLLAAPAAAQTSVQQLRGAKPGPLGIAAGPTTGVYFTVGRALCELLAPAPCASRVTAGSVANVELLRAGDAAYAIVQTDVAQTALKGLGRFGLAGPCGTLRSVAALHAEVFTVAVRGADPARTLADLKGRKLGFGAIGSGDRPSGERILALAGWTPGDVAVARGLTRSIAAKALCGGEVDALFTIIGHPNDFGFELAQACRTRFVPLAPEDVRRAADGDPTFGPASIPAGAYPTLRADVPSVGLRALLLTTASRPDAEVALLVARLRAGLPRLAAAHPALARLAVADLTPPAEAPPLHAGAR